MAHSKTKAGKLLGSLAETSVKDWDQLLIELSREWTRAYANRQIQALVEGVNFPPPPPPEIPKGFPNQTAKSANDVSKIETISDLVDCYRTKENSTYHSLRYQTRSFYDGQFKRILVECGNLKLSELDTENIQSLRDAWATNSGESMANSLFSILRITINFGASTLQDKECDRLAGAIKRVKLPEPQIRKTIITAKQAEAICLEAHKHGRHSIALAQAFQFDCRLAQKDVIGEWVPLSENGYSEIIDKNEKWLNGLRWNEIDSNLVLTHAASRNGKEIKINLRNCPMVMAELARIPVRPARGAIVICESSGLPWIPGEFRRWWRKLARGADIPDTITNAGSSVGDDGDQDDELKASES